MISIPLRDNPPSQTWLERAEAATQLLLDAQSDTERKAIIDSKDTIWRDLKDHLSSLSNGKCWYSEAKEIYSHYHVDHFRPKKAAIGIDKQDYGGYWWLAFDWGNYRLCGSVGNGKKRDEFAVQRNKCCSPADPLDDEIFYLLDPTDDDDPDKISFQVDGKAVPLSTDENDWDYKRADYTIKKMDLNYPPLKDARKEIWADCVNKLNELQNLMHEQNQSQSATRAAIIKQKLKELRTKAHRDTELSATAKTCLLTSGLPWAQKLATSN